MTPQARSGLSTFEWLSILGGTIAFVILAMAAGAAWAYGTFTPRTETTIIVQHLDEQHKELKDTVERIEARQLGERPKTERKQ